MGPWSQDDRVSCSLCAGLRIDGTAKSHDLLARRQRPPTPPPHPTPLHGTPLPLPPPPLLSYSTALLVCPVGCLRKTQAKPPPLPPIGRHTETLERPQRGRARESEHERARELQNRTTPRNPKTSREPRRLSKSSTGDKRSPDVVAPDLKKIKREPETKPEAMPILTCLILGLNERKQQTPI